MRLGWQQLDLRKGQSEHQSGYGRHIRSGLAVIFDGLWAYFQSFWTSHLIPPFLKTFLRHQMTFVFDGPSQEPLTHR